ncbi:hypothetical protein BDN72DRAFT_845884 [Pluteus cervinus]|uniref:Uncharacterized protein n=1 Tax=Pluteus cervinus TaxID=181527 RepID=A0ACD3AHD7_9AGAR|nr:hypothetical protein BDN72DRAFT_845884 [Pluteus cervinus]
MDHQQAQWTRQKIDAEIHQLRVQISTLATRRNTLVPISRLLPEVMTEIFLEARHATKSMPKSRFVLFMNSVCRYWREIYGDNPTLWSWLDLRHPEATL